MIPDRELSIPHSVPPDEWFFLINASSLGSFFRHKEEDEDREGSPSFNDFLGTVGGLVILIPIVNWRFQRNLHVANCGTEWNVLGFCVARHVFFSLAFLLLGFGPLLFIPLFLVSDSEFLGVTPQ
jgi:hypothetical protein